MLRFWKWSILSCGLLASVLMLSLLAADDDKDAKKSADKPDVKAEDKPADLDKVPDGTNEELMAYIKKVMSVEPKSPEDMVKMKKALGKAADKILDATPTEQDLADIVRLRIRLLETPEEAKAYVDKLAKNGETLTKAGKAELGRAMVSMSYLVKLQTATDIEEFKKAIEESLKYLGESKLQKGDLMLAMTIGQSIEHIDDPKFAGETLEKIIALFKDGKFEGEEKVRADKFAKRLEGTLRRMKLVGNRIELEGNLLSGDKLDLAI